MIHRLPRLSVALLASALALAACGGDGGTGPTPPAAVRVTVTPTTATVQAGGTTTFTAAVANATAGGVTWTASGGTLTPSGTSATWTAPGAGGSYTITATASADPTKSASAIVTVTPVGVSVSPSASTVGAGDTLSLTAAITNGVNADVTWRATAGRVIGSGATVQWEAPLSGGRYDVTAVSVLDTTRRATASITVTPVVVQIASAATALFRGASTTLTATVTGTGDPRVTWSASCGAVEGTGASVQYRAPETPGDCVVSAASVRDPSTVGRDTITVRRAWRVATLTDTDDGACTFAHCSLREALAVSNAAADVDSIVLLPEASAGGTITLTAALPFISAPVHLVGPGASALTIDANASVASPRGVLYVNGAVTVSVRGVTLRGGHRTGGGGVVVDNGAQLTLTDTHVRDNVSANAAGGGLLALRGGRATLVNVDVMGNQATGAGGPGGGLSVEPGSEIVMRGGRVVDNRSVSAFGGGARVFNGRLQLDSVRVADNRAPDAQVPLGIGGAVFSDGADAELEITGSTIEDNAAGFSGGALAVRGGTTATIRHTVIRRNTAPVAAGLEVGSAAVTVDSSEISANTATQRGGGVFVFGTGTFTQRGGAIRDNAGGSGGGGGLYLQEDAAIALTDVAVNANRVSDNNGGGIWAAGNAAIAMTRGSISQNTGAIVGGGLFFSVSRPLSLTDVAIEENTARDGGGGVFLTVGAQLVGGTVRGGRIAGNQVTVGGGGGVFAQNLSLTFEQVTFAANTAAQGGGALLGLQGGAFTFIDVTAEDNTASIGGAFGFNGTMGLEFTRGTIRRNTSTSVGGGLWKAGQSTLTMTGTTIRDNVAATQGGGIQLAGPGGGAFLTNVTVQGNRATGASGGGVTSGVFVEITGSTFADNTSGAIGGGLFAAFTGNSVVRNSTFSNNSALVGGGIAATGPAALTNVTLVGNRAADYGGGIGTNNAGAMTVTNVLLAGNRVGEAAGNCGRGGTSTITSSGGNLSDDVNCDTFTQGTDLTNTAAGLSPTLADNGGPTWTHALLTGSAAINAAVPAACPVTDQRGFARSGGCDIGAVEFGGVAPARRGSR